jgi:hypothetical protein
MALGRADALRQRDEVCRFFGWQSTLGFRGHRQPAFVERRRDPILRPAEPAGAAQGGPTKIAACAATDPAASLKKPIAHATPTLRHHRPALRQRQLPHRPHHGVHPGRHLGAHQRMQGNAVNFVCADDAHGAPIMIAAEKAGKTPQQFVADIAAGRKPYLDGFHIAFDNWHSTDAPENHALAQQIYRDLREAGLIETRTIEQFFDPEKNMFLPDRFIKGECPRATPRTSTATTARCAARCMRPPT